MGDFLTIDGAEHVRVSVRRHARARRLSLRVSRIDGQASVTAPPWVSENELRSFLGDKREWLLKACGTGGQLHHVAHGSELPVLGTPHIVRVDSRIRGAAIIENGIISVPSPADSAGVRAEAALKLLARGTILPRATAYGAKVGRAPSGVSLRDTRSRWGSCTHDGRLMFSWRLALAPLEVLDYVVAHEVAHLVEMNHSPAFWAVVERLKPGFKPHRAWLKKNGHALHRWRFQH